PPARPARAAPRAAPRSRAPSPGDAWPSPSWATATLLAADRRVNRRAGGGVLVLLDVDARLRLLKPPARAPRARGEDLREDRDGRLRLRVRADVEAARPRDPLQLRLVDAGLEQPHAALLLVPARAQRADVERLRRERLLQR